LTNLGGRPHRDWAIARRHLVRRVRVLAAMASETSTISIGSLVANPILRPPAVLARAVATVDQLSGGRFELGIGTGIAGFDHDAPEPRTGQWRRVERFTEYVEIVDELLSRAPEPVDYQGRWHTCRGLGLAPHRCASHDPH